MDVKALIDGLTPKNYRDEMDPEERIQFDQQYPDADEKIQFLAKHKALPYQHDVESFEKPDFFTRIRREGLGIYTGPERALLKKQQRLLQDQWEPVQKARQQVGMALMHELARAPETTGEAPLVDQTLGFAQGQGQAGLQPAPMGAGPGPAMNGLQPAPAGGPMQPQAGPLTPSQNLTPLPDGSPQMMRRPGEAPADLMQANMPDGTPGRLAALQQTGQMLEAPMRGVDTASMLPGPPGANGQPMDGMIVRPEPMMVADRKVLPAPPVPAKPRALKPWEQFQAIDTLKSQASGHLVPDGKGGLVPFHPESQLLDANQQQELASIYGGSAHSGRAKLPAAPLMQALKGKSEQLSQPVKDQLAADGLPATPANITMAQNRIDERGLNKEKAAIEFKESLQAGSQKTRDFLYSKTGKAFLTQATPQEVDQAIKDASNQEVSEHARKLLDTFNLGGLDGQEKEKLLGLQQILHVTHRLKTEFTPEERRDFVGKLDNPKEKIAQFVQENPRFAKFDALVNREGIAAFETGGKALTAQEAQIIFGFLPNAKEWSPANFEAKLAEADDYGRSKIGTLVQVATTMRRDMAKKMEEAMPKETGPKKISGDDDYAKLKPGQSYIDPKGTLRRKQ